MRGFTLIELLAVLMIIGILASIGIPRYQKTVETSKADEAQALLQTVYAANRMYKINNPSCDYCNSNTFTCPASPAGCAGGGTLVTRQYLTNLNSPVRPYTYRSADGAASGAPNWGAGSYIACARRNAGDAPYNAWYYWIETDGDLCVGGAAPGASAAGCGAAPGCAP